MPTENEQVTNEENTEPSKLKSILRNGVQIVVVDESSAKDRESPQKVPFELTVEDVQNQLINGFKDDDGAGSCFQDLDDQHLQILPDNDFQSSLSINESQGCQARDDVIIVDHLPIPPDGEYGWVVVAAAFVCNLIVDGISNAFGPFMAAYQKEFGANKSAVSLIGSILIGMYLLSGPVVGGLLNNFETRRIVVCGAIIASLSFILSTFSPNIFVYYFVYGILGGIGFGFIYLPAIVIVSQYFEAKRALATGIAVSGSGVGTFLIPLLSKYLIESFGWKIAIYCLAALILLCVFCGLLFKPLPLPEFDIEKQNRLAIELKQQALLAALSRADDGDDECNSNISDEVTTNGGGVSPVKRSATTRTSSQCTKEDGQPLLMNGLEGGIDFQKGDENADEMVSSSPLTPHRPPLSPIPESGKRRLSKSRAGSVQQSHADGISGRHPTVVSNRTRKPTLTSMANDAWMGSSNQLRLSRVNLNSQLSRVSARSYAQSLSRLSQAPPQSIKGESTLSVALSGAEPKEFARPLSRHDIFLQGSIRNLREFESEGNNYQRYRESQISIPMIIAAQNLSSSLSHACGDMVESSNRFGGSQYSRITGGEGTEFCEDLEGQQQDTSRFKFIPLPMRQAISEMVSLSLLSDPVMVLLCISSIFGMLGFYVPFVFLIELAVSEGISLSEATLLLSLIGISNTFGRVFFGWMADRRWVSALTITNWSLISCGLLTAFCPLFPNYLMLITYSCLFGFIVSAYVCLTSILLSDLLGVERLTNSFGILVVARGISSLLGTPLAGIVFDLTQSYIAAFVFAGSLIVISGLISCCIYFVHRYQRSQLRNEGDYVEPQKKTFIPLEQADATSGKLSVLTERSEEYLTEYQRTIQSIHQQKALLQELEQYKQRNLINEEGEEDDGEGMGDGRGGGGEQEENLLEEDEENNFKNKKEEDEQIINHVENKNKEIDVGD
uniref:Major facilitator superfamily (MFS) profile domain-containing protein n=1 Tax=Meloidogyne incognita TaxID=6306 RepID=A0A914LXD9_MELIC